MIVPVVLSGGSGTRLWPLSTPARPKQFLRLTSEQTLFQETLLRLRGIEGLGAPIVIANQAHGALIAAQLAEIATAARAIVLEPAGRNTAPAIAAAALLAAGAAAAPAPDETVILTLPADHVIRDGAAFRAAIGLAVAAAGTGRLVTFGIVPTHAETGYGYIERGAASAAGWAEVERFVEKPDAATAETYVESGRYFWNSGMFVFRVGTILDELERHAPAVLSACQAAVAAATERDGCLRLGDDFLASPSDSIDYAIMEKTERAAVVPLDAGWSDIGSWAALHAVLAKDSGGNAVRGEAVLVDANGNLVLAESRKIALLGLDDVVVIDSGEALLVIKKDRSQEVKQLQARLEADKGPT